MDHASFDKLARALGTEGTRRAALTSLFGAGLAGTAGLAEARRGRKKRKAGAKAKVAAQATCSTPGPSANLAGCNFNGQDFSGDDLSGSRLVGTLFRAATLAGTNLSSSNARNADFRQANLSCANLRSSTLSGANFNAANLTLADLKSSGGCNTASFNAATTFCATTMCDGSVRNDDCPGGFDPAKACCVDADCGTGAVCDGNQCVRICPVRGHNEPCNCRAAVGGPGSFCVNALGLCFTPACTSDAQCGPGTHCITTFCDDRAGRCGPPCPFPDDCVCRPGGLFDECGRRE